MECRAGSFAGIRRVLESVAPRGGIVRTDDARNLITLSGNRQDIASMMEAIALFDIDTMKGMSFALVPGNYGDSAPNLPRALSSRHPTMCIQCQRGLSEPPPRP